MRDVIVIGAGGGGAVVAKELAARGLDVLMLEAGPAAKPERDWTHFEIDQSSSVSGNSPRAVPGVFHGYRGADAAAYDRAHEFPFGYRELIPYYEWVENTLPVQTAPMGRKEETFLNGAAALGLPVQRTKDLKGASFRPQENAILQPGGFAGKSDDSHRLFFPLARGCTFCGHCLQGCMEPLRAPRNLHAKRSTDNSCMPMAFTADRWTRGKAVTLVSNAYVTRIVTETVRGEVVARGVAWRSTLTGETHAEDARVVVLAAGAIESPRLWLTSGLPDPNGWVGRGLTDHQFDVVVGLMPSDIGASKGPGSGARVDYPGRGALEGTCVTPAIAALSSTLSDSGTSGMYDNGAPVGAGGADGVGRAVGRNLKALLADVDRLLGVVVLTDDDVEAQNRVSLSAALPADEHGPVARVEVRHRQRSARTAANREFLATRAVELARAAGALAVFRVNWPPVLAHIHSTLRMGHSAADSVLDRRGEARAVRRLFVADNSALANSVGGMNPTLTMQALATSTPERIFRSYFDGDPWVEEESTISSTDPRVTRAVVASEAGTPALQLDHHRGGE